MYFIADNMNTKYFMFCLVNFMSFVNIHPFLSFRPVHLHLFYYHKKNIIIIGPYEIRFISKFIFFIFIFLYSVLMVKLNFINQKACLINWVLNFIFTKFCFPLFSGFHFNVPLIFFFFLFRNTAHLHFSPK